MTSTQYDFARADFNSVYLGGQLIEGAGITRVPWDIEAEQPAVVDFHKLGRFRGEILDVGCGLGDNAIYLARLGHKVTAIDAASAAIEQARVRAAGLDIEWAVTDATDLSEYTGRFDTVLDSALYHTLDAVNRKLYVAAIHRATAPGARLNLLSFAAVPGGMPEPLAVAEQTLRDDLAEAGWKITSLGQTRFAGATEAVIGFLNKVGAEPVFDSLGRVTLPVWTVQADRA
jgi:SAM-dependent methyltransferase